MNMDGSNSTPETTEYYGLVKPGPDEFYDVEVGNRNLDQVDTVLHVLADQKAEQETVAAGFAGVNAEIQKVRQVAEGAKTTADSIRGAASEAKTTAEAAAAAVGKEVKSRTDADSALQSGLNTHSADNGKHISAAERANWNGKAETAAVTTKANGLMAAADKVKLDGISASANKTTIANNLTTTAAGSALDAVQGKVIGDKLGRMEGTIDAYVPEPTAENQIEISKLEGGKLVRVNADFAGAKPKAVTGLTVEKLKGGIDSYTKLMLHLDKDCTDSSGNNVVVTNVGGVSTDYSGRFEEAFLFSGSNYLTVPWSIDLDLTEDFTYDFWIYPTARKKGGIVSRGVAAGRESFDIFIGEDGKITALIQRNNISCVVDSTTILQINKWHHIEVSRLGNQFMLFINGVKEASATTTDVPTSNSMMRIGLHRDGYYFFGKIDEFRISKGIVRHTENFATPTIQYSDTEALTLMWKNPSETFLSQRTILRRSSEGYPASPTDGVQVYSGTGETFLDTDADTRADQYYTAWTDNGLMQTTCESMRVKYNAYKTMTVKIDLANSNPSTCITYADDAVGMTPGSADWDNFFGHRPCLFKDGKVVGYLNPNDFTKFENGTAADITSGNAGDVMIEFPRRGLKITTVGNLLTVTMTDVPDDADFKYLAHTRGSTSKEKFYIGAYKGFTLSSKLRSLSGKAPTASQTIGTFRIQAQANGAGYENSGFYQLVFRQSMYLLKYRNLNSQVTVGMGNVNSSLKSTGTTNTRGMTWGSTSTTEQMKLFGIEDFWGNIWEWIDGIATDASWKIFTNTSNFQDDGKGSGYVNNGQGVTANTDGWMSKPQGKTETGFLAKEVGSSETTCFSDLANLYGGRVAKLGGNWADGSRAGAFFLGVSDPASKFDSYVGGRLMYL